MLNCIKKKNNNKAQAIMELAICLPVIAILFFFIFDASRVIIAKQDLMQATRNSIRYLSFQEPSKAAKETVSGNLSNYLIRNTLTKGIIEDNSDVMLSGMNIIADGKITVQNAQGSPILAYGCVKVKLIYPYIWGDADGNGKIQICQGYYMERTMTETKNSVAQSGQTPH